MFEKGNKYGLKTRFSSGNQPTKRGRKPALYRQIASKKVAKGDFFLSKEDYYKVIRYLMERNQIELEDILEDKNTPIVISNIIRAIMSDVKHGRMKTLDQAFDRIFGKPKQFQGCTLTAKGKRVDNDDMTEEQILSMLEQVNKEFDAKFGKKLPGYEK